MTSILTFKTYARIFVMAIGSTTVNIVSKINENNPDKQPITNYEYRNSKI